jgi:hypothetical protein
MPYLTQTNSPCADTAKNIERRVRFFRIAPFEGGGNRFLLRGFRCDDRFIQAAFAAIGHIAVNYTALGCLVQSGGETVEFDLGRCRVTAGDDGAKLLLA